jgi:hypothetical protein
MQPKVFRLDYQPDQSLQPDLVSFELGNQNLEAFVHVFARLLVRPL